MPSFPRIRRPALALAAAVAVFFLLQEAIAPIAVRTIVRSLLRKHCASCRFELGGIRLHLFPVSLVLSAVTFEAGSSETLLVSAKCARIEAGVSPWALLRKSLRLGKIHLFKADVIVIEGDHDSASSADAPTSLTTAGGDAEVDQIVVEEGSFSYIRRHLNRDAALKLSAVSIDIGPFGSSSRRRDQKAKGRAQGQLEKSGHFDLSVEAALFNDKADLDIDLKIAQQNLGDLNVYFEPGEGIKLGGILEEGHGKVGVRGERGAVWVYAKYKGLNFDLRKTAQRSALSAMLTNFISSLITHKDNRTKDWIDRTQQVTVQRKSKESLVGFLLRGLKEATLQIPRH